MTTDSVHISRRDGPRHASWRHAAARTVMDHPIVSVVIVALVVRMILAVGASIVTDRNVIPDEGLYLELGRQIVHGVKPDEWYPGYGQSFYDSLEAFTAPLVFLFRIFGPHQVVGRLFAVAFGVATAGVTTAIALRFLRRPFAVAAGLIVALAPSQVLFSSVMLRESEVWLCLALVGLGAVLMTGTEWRQLAGGAAIAIVALLTLGWLRDQTMLAAAWALALALVVTPKRRWLPRVAAGVAIAAVIPWVAATGWGGVALVRAHATTLEKERATLATAANSAFGSTSTPGAATRPTTTPSGAAAPQPTTTTPSKGTISDEARAATNADQGVRAGIRHVPVGLVDVMMRPFAWQPTVGMTLLLAKGETLLWYVLYVLSAIGVVAALRRSSWRLALQFPVIVFGIIAAIAAVTQGNLGTAFRHRNQLLWILALCSAAGLQWLLLESRWAPRRATTGTPDEPEIAEPEVAAPAEPALRR